MLDKDEKFSDKVDLVLRQDKGKTYVDIIADEAFLKDVNTKYPVVIDPTINNWNIMTDTFISSWIPNSSFSSLSNFYTGNDGGYYGKMRSLIKFFLPSLPSDSYITSANFNAYQNKLDNVNVTIDLFRNTSDWTESVTWNTQPTIGQTLESSLTTNAYNQYLQWDITQLVKDWYNGDHSNYGLMLKQRNEDGYQFRRFTSVESYQSTPRLIVNYTVEPIGLEDFWGYTKDGVNPANGNLVLQQSDLAIPGRGIPVELTRTFNSRKTYVTSMFGNGWRSNLETIIVDAGTGPITLVDGDSTRHIFGQKIGGGYEAAGGVYLDLEKHSNGTYTITQTDGSKVHFNTSGKIISMVDTNGNTTTLNYTNGKLTSIKDASGRTTSFQYNSNGLVSSVTDPASKVTSYEYDTSNNLTKVINPEDKAISMTYGTDKSLTTITDQRNIATNINYDGSNRVSSILRPITIDGVVTNSTTTYGYNTATSTITVVDGEGKRVDYQYNPNKNIVQITEDPLDSANKSITTFAYDDKNNLVKVTDANSNKLGTNSSYIYKYDDKGNIIEVQLPEGQTNQFWYDGNNNLIGENDPNGNESNYLYDSNSNQLESIDSITQAVAARYSNVGNLNYSTKNISSADNRVINSSFENDSNTDDWPDNWTKFQESGKTATFNWTNESKYGNQSISISNPMGWAVATTDLIPYEVGNSYIASGYIKTDNVKGGALIKIEYYNSLGELLGETYSYTIKGTHDWTKVQVVVDKAPIGTTHMRVSAAVNAGEGTAYFDAIQMEKGTVLSSYNLMENGSFERYNLGTGMPNSWTTSGNFSINDKVYKKANPSDDNVHASENSFQITGEIGKDKFIRQRVNISGDINTKLTLSGWSKQEGANPNGSNYGIQVAINNTDGTQDWTNANDFNKSEEDWQHIAAQVKAKKPFNSIDVYYFYYNQTGKAYFDATRLEIGDSITSQSYDAGENYVTSIKDPAGNSVSFGYDLVGNRTSLTDGKGKITLFNYDKRNLLTKVTDSKGNITNYGYDNSGNRTTVTDARSKITKYDYNEFNLISKITNPLNQVTKFDYDKNGNQTKLIYPKGDIISSSYNALNRLEKISYNGVERFSYGYDANGNVTSISDKSSGKNQTFTYDKNDRLIKEQTGDNSIQYNYDNNNNLTSLVKAAGANSVVDGYKYNQLNQIVQLTRNSSNLAQFIYNEEGNITTTNRENNTSTSFLFDDANRLDTIINFSSNGNLINKFSYKYDWSSVKKKDKLNIINPYSVK